MRLSLSAICVVYVHQFTLAVHVPDGAGVGLLSAIRRLHTGCPVVLLKQTLLYSIRYCHSHVYASPPERRDSTRHCHSHVYAGPPKHCERQKAPNKSISGRAHQLSDRIPITDRPYDGSAHRHIGTLAHRHILRDSRTSSPAGSNATKTRPSANAHLNPAPPSSQRCITHVFQTSSVFLGNRPPNILSPAAPNSCVWFWCHHWQHIAAEFLSNPKSFCMQQLHCPSHRHHLCGVKT